MYGNSIEGTDEARQLIKQGHILHELGHMLGLPHEHQRRDAREYVDFDTPASGQEKSFKNSIEPDDLYWPPTCSEDTSCDIHERSWTKPYLYSSIMHYNSWRVRSPQVSSLIVRFATCAVAPPLTLTTLPIRAMTSAITGADLP